MTLILPSYFLFSVTIRDNDYLIIYEEVISTSIDFRSLTKEATLFENNLWIRLWKELNYKNEKTPIPSRENTEIEYLGKDHGRYKEKDGTNHNAIIVIEHNEKEYVFKNEFMWGIAAMYRHQQYEKYWKKILCAIAEKTNKKITETNFAIKKVFFKPKNKK